MTNSPITQSGTFAALAIACAMAALSAQPVAAQTAKDLKCKGCVSGTDIKNNGIKSADIKNGQVKNADLANNAVNGKKIADGTVGNVDLGGNAITSNKIADGAVTANKLNSNVILPLKIVDSKGVFVGHLIGTSQVLIQTGNSTFALGVGPAFIGSNLNVWFEDIACTIDPFLRQDEGARTGGLVSSAAVAKGDVYVPLPNPVDLMHEAQSLLEQDGSCSEIADGTVIGYPAAIDTGFSPLAFEPPFEIRE